MKKAVARALIRRGCSTEKILWILRRAAPASRPSRAMIDRLRASRPRAR